MIKRILILIFSSLLLVGCGVVCKDEPPKRAVMQENGGMGMQYHFVLYEPVGDAGHTPSLKCTNYEYGRSHLYTDSLGVVQGDAIIWEAYHQGESASMLPEDIQNHTSFIFSKSAVTIKGATEAYSYLNGEWRIETSSPNSWGVPIY